MSVDLGTKYIRNHHSDFTIVHVVLKRRIQPMKIALFGATGMVGQRILKEAIGRGHSVTAIVRDTSKITDTNPSITAAAGDILDSKQVASLVTGADAVVSAISPGANSNDIYIAAVNSLAAGLAEAGIKRIIFVGGAGSLEVAPGVQLVDTPNFPEIYKARASAMRDELEYIRTSDLALDWTYVSPSAFISPGDRTGKFRVGGDQLLVDSEGKSSISAEDFAVAVVDEIEKAEHVKQRITVGY
jgi:putative NADH-flavin reductase